MTQLTPGYPGASKPRTIRQIELPMPTLLETMETSNLPKVRAQYNQGVMSEMGRFPQENARGGKEHWTYTSALLMGSGVRGGQTIGGYDEYCFGKKVELGSGEVSNQGVSLLPGHFGATLLQLADIDYGDFVVGAQPIWAAIQ